ncbi:MAG: protein phosphatase 2C domain-containing protein [bacterium]
MKTDVVPGAERKPRDDELDVYGLTHTGNVRAENQDHFLLASIHKRVEVVQTSLSDLQRLPLGSERLAFLAMIADGVGGGEGGEEASSTALEIAMQYVAQSMNCYYSNAYSNAFAEKTFIDALQDAAMRSHEAVRVRAEQAKISGTMATTLTLFLAVWPWYYILQVGDSRYYLWRDGRLEQLTRDQTIAQDLVDQGVLTRASAGRSPLGNVLSSAIGGEQTAPVVTRLQADWRNVHLMCSDGLTKHVSDERIAERLASMVSAEQVSKQLLQDALDGGGSDNITIIVGRAMPNDGAA